MNEYITKEELEDLECEFSEENIDILDEFEDYLIGFYKADQYQAFIDLIEKIKVFCYSKGIGGVEYFKNNWKDDPRLSICKQNLNLKSKYSKNATHDEIYKEIADYIQEKKIVRAKEIYQQFQWFERDQIQKSISTLCKKKIIRKGYDKNGYKILILL